MTSAEWKRYKQLRKKGYTRDLTREEDRELHALGKIRHREIHDATPRPKCCSAAQSSAVIWLSFDDFDNSNEAEPRWAIARNDNRYSDELDASGSKERWERTPPPKFCPFCATPLPRMVRMKKPPKPLCLITDGGYYCDTCEQRLMDCSCFPVVCAFGPAP